MEYFQTFYTEQRISKGHLFIHLFVPSFVHSLNKHVLNILYTLNIVLRPENQMSLCAQGSSGVSTESHASQEAL